MSEQASPLNLQGKGVLVTGASSGIGQAVAIALASQGCRVALLGRDPQRLASARDQCSGTGHKVVACDLSEALHQLPAMMNGLAETFGPLYGVVHCAGIQSTKSLRWLNLSDLDAVFRINVHAGLMLAKAFRPRQVREAKSSIVFVSSVMSRLGAAAGSAYSASKGAVEAMTRSIAVELAAEGVRVNAVAPGFVKTDMFDKFKSLLTAKQLAEIEARHLLGFGEPVAIAHAALFLLSDMSAWVTGTTLVVDGGYTIH